MNDIVQRLRQLGVDWDPRRTWHSQVEEFMSEGADEIERLRAEVSHLHRRAERRRKATAVWMDNHRAKIAKLQASADHEAAFVASLRARVAELEAERDDWQRRAMGGAS